MSESPEYERPPVVEVAMGIQFPRLEKFTAGHLGLYWSGIRREFPNIEEHPPIAHVIEDARPNPAGAMEQRLEFVDQPVLPRTWFYDSPGNHLIQVQQDRFLHNWRRLTRADDYPRYKAVRDKFFRYWDGFCGFLTDQGFPIPQPDQLELTYVNFIRQGEGWDAMPDLPQLFTWARWDPRQGRLEQPEVIRWGAKFLLPENMGRLHVDVQPAIASDDKALVLRFSLTARGKPSGESASEQMTSWYDTAQKAITSAFLNLVTDKTDGLWGRIR